MCITKLLRFITPYIHKWPLSHSDGDHHESIYVSINSCHASNVIYQGRSSSPDDDECTNSWSSTNKTISCSSSSSSWCVIAYWELRNRVGRLFEVETQDINVFSYSPQCDGLCLSDIARHKSASTSGSRSSERDPLTSSSQSDSVIRTREKIGFGVTISREGSEVWVHNQSQHAVFLNSSTLDPPNTKQLTVFRLDPGQRIKAFDYDIANKYKHIYKFEPPDGPVDFNSIRISFIKGWGNGYSRQCITSCPCWIEVLLKPR